VHRDDNAEAQRINVLATSPRMGHIAAELLGVPSVRLYQTSVREHVCACVCERCVCVCVLCVCVCVCVREKMT